MAPDHCVSGCSRASWKAKLDVWGEQVSETTELLLAGGALARDSDQKILELR